MFVPSSMLRLSKASEASTKGGFRIRIRVLIEDLTTSVDCISCTYSFVVRTWV